MRENNSAEAHIITDATVFQWLRLDCGFVKQIYGRRNSTPSFYDPLALIRF